MKRLVLLLLFTASAWAQPLQVQTSQNADSALRPLTTQQQATAWGVTPEEWQRYLTLKQQARGVWSPGLDPLTTLGVEADTDHERQRFAELLVRQEYQRLEKELAFQRAYDAAWQRLYPGLTPLKTTSTSTARISLFVQEDCPPCDSLHPLQNLSLTAQLLRQRYDERPGSWLNAAARYHRPAGGAPAARYRKLVSRHLQQAAPP